MNNQFAKYRFFVLALLITFFSSVNAQNITISKQTKLTNKLPKFRLLGELNGKILVDRFGSYQHEIDVYDKQLKILQTKTLSLNKNQWVEKIWIQPTKGFLIVSEAEKSYSVIKASKIDAKLNISEKKTVLDTLYTKRDVLLNNYRTELSLNERVLATYLPSFESNKLNSFNIKVYDEDLALMQSRVIKDPDMAKYAFADFEVFNTGDFVLVLAKEMEDDDVYRDFKVFYGGVGNGVIQAYDYSASQTIFHKPKFEIDNLAGELLVSGFYLAGKVRKNEKDASTAFFYDRMNAATGAKLGRYEYSFNDDFFFKVTGKEGNGVEENKLYTFYINRIIPKVNGGAVVLAESYYKEQENDLMTVSGFGMPGFNSYELIQYYNYNDIIVFDIDSLGDFDSPEVIRKRQVSENDNGAFSSFYLMNERDKLKTIFLDEIFVQGNLSATEIQEGDYESLPSSLMNIGEKDIFPIVKLSYQTKVNEIIIPSYLNNYVSLVKIVYPL